MNIFSDIEFARTHDNYNFNFTLNERSLVALNFTLKFTQEWYPVASKKYVVLLLSLSPVVHDGFFFFLTS